MSLQLRIVTPDGEVVSTQVDTVRITGVEGEFGILPGHLPFLSGLEVGPAAFETESLLASLHWPHHDDPAVAEPSLAPRQNALSS